MKKLSVLAALCSATFLSYSQGTVAFSNGFLSAVQTYDGSGQLINVPVDFPIVYGLFYGPTATSLSLSPILGAPSTTTTGLILVNGASAVAYQLPGTHPNDTPFIQVKAWSSSFGSDWQAALYASRSNDPAVYGGVYFGETAVVQANGLGPNTGPGIPIWQSASGTSPNRFTPLLVSHAVPEPSTIALCVSGGLIFCLACCRPSEKFCADF